MTLDKLTFLEARLTEDIQQARGMLKDTPTPEDSLENGWDFEWADRVMAESEAKARILGMYATYASEAAKRSGIAALAPEIGRDVLRDVIDALAAVYKDHKDYDGE